MEPVWLFLIFLRASLFSLGGQTGLPLLRQDLVGAGFVSDQRIIEALTIGRLGTGPGGLYLIALGYFAMGLVGAIAAGVAMILPPLLVVPFAAFLRPRMRDLRINGAIRGLSLVTSGLVIATGIDLFREQSGGGNPAAWQVLVLALAGAAGLQGRLHPIWIIAGGAGVGLLTAGGGK